MTNQLSSDLGSAINALSSIMETIERRIDALDESAGQLTRARRTYLTSAAATMLPAISKGTLRCLHEVVPDFVTAEVEARIRRNFKVLGLFARSGYNQTLTQLQTRLASFLDGKKHGEVANFDARLKSICDEKQQMHDKSNELLKLLAVMQEGHQRDVSLPGELKEQLKKIVSASQSFPIVQPVSAATSPQSVVGLARSDQSRYSADESFDLWLYLATDIPTSLRTLMLDVIKEHHVEDDLARGGSFGGGGASGDYTSAMGDDSPGTSFDGDSVSPAAVIGGAAALGVAGAAMFGDQITDIATDDSLGAFS
ncbi:hypothetical protein [Pseudomonas lactis]|uniref:hypothetical protein n=1 Tax=Pseudomonas lactis TaxID=1615674 RepID=UPI003F7D6BB8